MEVGKAIYELLTTDATVGALIGTKVFPVHAPQNTLFPYLVYEERLSDPIITKEGPVFRDWVTVDIIVDGKTYSEVQNILKASRAALEWFQGTAGGIEIARITFNTVLAPMWDRQTECFQGVNRYTIKIN